MRTLFTGLFGLILLAGAGTIASAEERWHDHERPVVGFEVIRTHLVTRECDSCEYRRRASGLGVFRVEERLYAELLHGHVVQTWRQTEEFFDHCAGSWEG